MARLLTFGLRSAWNLGFDELCEQRKRLLPAEIARLGRDGLGDPLLDNAHLGAARDLLQRHGSLHFPGKTRIVEFVRMPNALIPHQLQIFPAERMTVACAESG